MKIALVCGSLFPYDIGGVEKHVFAIARELSKRRHEVHIFTFIRRGNTSAETLDDFHVFELPLLFKFGSRFRFPRRLANHLIGGGFDVIHCHSYRMPHSFLSVLAGALANTPTILTTHFNVFEPKRALHKKLVDLVYDSSLGFLTLRLVKRVIVLTPPEKAYFVHLGMNPDNVYVIPNGVDSQLFHTFEMGAFREKWKISGSLILFVGRVHEAKGIQFMIRALPLVLREHPNIMFVIAGPDANYSNKLMRMATGLNVSDHIIFTGYIPEEEKIHAYADCDVFVLPSRHEAWSIAATEAQAFGKPVVATRAGGIPYNVLNGETGILCEYGNVKQLADAVITLLSEYNLRRRLGENGKKHASAFTWNKIVDEIEKVYNQALG